MLTKKFKTNIKCAGCIAAVTPYLNNLSKTIEWEVDTVNPDKILTVRAEGVSAEEILFRIKEAGYTAQTIAPEL
ncbi:heavy-metal-associated domain-containing protein [Flavihumibacter sp. R14]|nr:heavy-metal-associated domain-containing protein [Flavihumibacter soli]